MAAHPQSGPPVKGCIPAGGLQGVGVAVRGQQSSERIRAELSDTVGHFRKASRLSLEVYMLAFPSGIWVSRCPGRRSKNNPIDKLPSNQADTA